MKSQPSTAPLGESANDNDGNTSLVSGRRASKQRPPPTATLGMGGAQDEYIRFREEARTASGRANERSRPLIHQSNDFSSKSGALISPDSSASPQADHRNVRGFRLRPKKLVTKEELLQENCSQFFPLSEGGESNNSSSHDYVNRSRHSANELLLRPDEPDRRPLGARTKALVADRRRRWTTLSNNESPQVDLDAPYGYGDAVDVLAPPVLMQYRARFQQLNCPVHCGPDEDEPPSGDFCEGDRMQNHDLRLEEQSPGGAAAITHVSSASLAVRRREELRLLQQRLKLELPQIAPGRLPRDRVRLCMDPDLQPGVLNVEQWRMKGDEEACDGYPQGRGDPDDASALLPPLRYVLTVDDGIYRRMIAELAAHHGLTKSGTVKEDRHHEDAILQRYYSNDHDDDILACCCNCCCSMHYWGCGGAGGCCFARQCCHPEQKADIRIAYTLILGVIFIMFVLACIWPES
jgi:hypothetical protein